MTNKFNQYLIEQLTNKETDCNVTQFKKLQGEYYKECHNNCDLKVGDKVKLTRLWTIDEYCSPMLWNPEFSKYIGSTFEIREKCSLSYKLSTTIHVPYFVLEKVEEEFVPLDYNDNLICKVVVGKDLKTNYLIVCQDKDGVFTGQNTWRVSYETLMDYYTFQDGLPCHKLKQ